MKPPPMKASGGEAHWSQLRSAHQLRVLLSDVQRKAREEELRIGRAALRAKQLEELLAERKRAAMPKMTAANRAKLQALGLNHVFSTRALTSALAEKEADAQRAESAAARKERLQVLGLNVRNRRAHSPGVRLTLTEWRLRAAQLLGAGARGAARDGRGQ